jgi:hypothetical protein
MWFEIFLKIVLELHVDFTFMKKSVILKPQPKQFEFKTYLQHILQTQKFGITNNQKKIPRIM